VWKWFLSVFILIVIFNSGIFADEKDSAGKNDPNGKDELFSMSLEDLMKVELTSSARRPQSLNRATRAMYVINSEDIRQAGPVRIEELLRQVPGMNVFRTKGLVYEVGSRGYTKWNNERMQILLDGRPVYDPYLGGSMLYLNPIFLDEIERIEVIRGSAGVTWGVNAMNGVVNIITKKAADTQGGLIYGGVGSHDLQQGFVRYGGTTGKLSWRAMAGGFFEDGFTNEHDSGTGKQKTDFFDAFQSTGRADLQLQDDLAMIFTGGQQNASSNNESRQYMNMLLTKKFEDDSSLQVRWSESYITRTKVKNYYTSANSSLYSLSNIRSREQMIEVQHTSFHDNHTLVLGADYTRDVYESSPRNNQYNTTPEDFTNNQASAFIEDEIALADNLWYTIGYRGHYNEFTKYDWAGSMALVWEFKKNHFLRGAISRSFRRPTMWQMFRSGATLYDKNGYTVNGEGNTSLRNETQIAYELGYRGQWAKNLFVNVEGFVDKDKDMMAVRKGVLQKYQPWLPGSTWEESTWYDYWDNVYDVTTYGVETSVEWKPYDWWLIRGFHTYLHQTNRSELTNWRTGETGIVLSPKHRVGLTNRFYIDKTTTLNTQLYWTDTATKSLEYIKGKPFWQLDIRLSKTLWHDTAEVAIGATGLLSQSHNETGYGDWDSEADLTEVPQTYYFQFFCKF